MYVVKVDAYTRALYIVEKCLSDLDDGLGGELEDEIVYEGNYEECIDFIKIVE